MVSIQRKESIMRYLSILCIVLLSLSGCATKELDDKTLALEQCSEIVQKLTVYSFNCEVEKYNLNELLKQQCVKRRWTKTE